MWLLKRNGRIIIIPKNKDRSNKYMYHFAKLFQQDMQTAHSCSGNNRGNQFRQSIKFNPPPLDLSFRNNNSGKTRNRSQNIK